MKLEDVKAVYQSSDIEQVNKKLKEGFELLKIAPSKIKASDYDYIGQVYILGCNK
jgi:hypothetical protein